MNQNIEKQSKFLSLVLRHKPDEIDLTLDSEGWAYIDELVQNASNHGTVLSRERIVEIVANSDKKRFAISQDGTRVRANQGHSIPVALNIPEREPPHTLFHGTATRFIRSIQEKGLISGSRQHVHLSFEKTTALDVGARYGKPVALIVHAGEMYKNGHRFYLSDNGVWLTAHVPHEFIEYPSDLRLDCEG
jgi:putative RNA 2'-phosphotransferase